MQRKESQKRVEIYCFKTCKQCVQYIEKVQELANQYEYENEIIYIETQPIIAYQALLEARQSGAWIQHAPFVIIYNLDKYKALGGILNTDHIEKLFKNYAKTE